MFDNAILTKISNAAVGFAKICIEKESFLPFAVRLNAKNEATINVPKSMKTDVTREELKKYWKHELEASLVNADILAVCTVCDVRLQDEERRPAMLMHIENIEGESWDLLHYYERNGAETVITEVQCDVSAGWLFPSKSPS